MDAATAHANRIMLVTGELGARMARNNRGRGLLGDWRIAREVTSVRLLPGDAVVRQARVVHFGCFEGGSDFLGLQPTLITPAMVGQTFARFAALEAKSGGGRLTGDQSRFLDMVRCLGGIAGEVRTPDDARRLLMQHGG